MLIFAEAQATTANGGSSLLSLALPFVLMIGLFIWMFSSQRKRQKEEQKLRNSIRVGDEITTIGGICGRVLQVKDDCLVIETGADRSKMTIKKWAIQSCDTVHANDDDDDFDDDDDI